MLEIEIFSDAICPWCFIGKRRLEAALSDENADLDPNVTLRWRPYMLYPNLPAQGADRALKYFPMPSAPGVLLVSAGSRRRSAMRTPTLIPT